LHDLTITKEGYGTLKVFGISHTYNKGTLATIVPTIQFGKKSSTAVSKFAVSSAVFEGIPGVSFAYEVTPTPSTSNKAFTRIFLSTSPNVSNTDYTAYTQVHAFSNNINILGFTADDLTGLGFTSGQTVYAKMYGESLQSNEYEDPNTGKVVFPNINPNSPAAVSFKVP